MLWYFDGCPNWQLVHQRLRDLGVEPALERVDTAEDAERLRFVGSPTALFRRPRPVRSRGGCRLRADVSSLPDARRAGGQSDGGAVARSVSDDLADDRAPVAPTPLGEFFKAQLGASSRHRDAARTPLPAPADLTERRVAKDV